MSRWSRGDLAYCSNVHPGAGADAVFGHLDGPLARVRRLRGLERMAAGLWLAEPARRALQSEPERLIRALDSAGISLITLNGFPYGDFHEPRVKERVYEPAWDRPERLAYSLGLARILADCLPAGAAEGTISTLPIGFSPGWDEQRQRQALVNLCRLAAGLADLADSTGIGIRVCLEPEPGCVIETTEQAIALFTEQLPAAARTNGLPDVVISEHLGVCLDCCHQAVMHEEPGEALLRLAEAGVALGKIQISSALEITEPSPEVLARVAKDLAEPRYLHQVRTRGPDGGVQGRMDLPDALADPDFPRERPWRVHFHCPIHAQALDLGGIRVATTRAAIGSLLDALAASPDLDPHLEVETYTWGVLPGGARPGDPAALEAGLAAELDWLETEMRRRALIRDETL